MAESTNTPHHTKPLLTQTEGDDRRFRRWTIVLIGLFLLFLIATIIWRFIVKPASAPTVVFTNPDGQTVTVSDDDWLPDAVVSDNNLTLEMKFGNN